MVRMIEGRDTGKTHRLMKEAKEKGCVFVCKRPDRMEQKAHSYGIVGINFISYYDFTGLLEYQDFLLSCDENPTEENLKTFVIDEIEDFITFISHGAVKGYSLTVED